MRNMCGGVGFTRSGSVGDEWVCVGHTKHLLKPIMSPELD